MEVLKYKIITSVKQYDSYCKMLEELVFSIPKTKAIKEEIALVTLLIKNYDEVHSNFEHLDPIRLLHSLMEDHNMKAKELVLLLDISKGYVSDILHYKKGLSKDVIRKLSKYFKLSQEAFNRPYKLVVTPNDHFRKRNAVDRKKKLAIA